MENKSKILAFDLGNVLFKFDYTLALNKIKDRMKLSISEVIYSLYDKNFTIPFEKGLVSGEQFHKNFCDEFGINFSYSEFVDVWCKIFSPITETIELVKLLKGQYPLYLISNINQLHFEYLYQEYKQVFSLFDRLILSYEVKSVKPELKIYQTLSNISGARFSDIIYIDDRQDLIIEASKLGLNCIQFENHQQLIKSLKHLKVIIE
ncbi:MAG: HAD family phosphatase [Candidatus Omnitrophica bacterium]|nr:HAD family phosphatase [Candidatus Omnitrophota bacterium]